LIAGGADVNKRGPERKTALHLACSNGHDAVVRTLLDAKADVGLRTERGETPLHLAATASVARALIAGGAEIDPRAPTFDHTHGHSNQPWPGSPLSVAAANGRVDVARLLIDKGAVIPEDLIIGVTFQGHVAVLRLLLEKGVDPNRELSHDLRPLHVAASNSIADVSGPDHVTPEIRLQMAKALIEAKADVNARIQQGSFGDFTALHGAAAIGDVQMIRLLLEHKADVNAAGTGEYYAGYTPLHIAVKSCHFQAAVALIKAGADVHARTGKKAIDPSKTPLELAPNEDVRALLLREAEK
jgi:ankyrin repeat protein